MPHTLTPPLAVNTSAILPAPTPNPGLTVQLDPTQRLLTPRYVGINASKLNAAGANCL